MAEVLLTVQLDTSSVFRGATLHDIEDMDHVAKPLRIARGELQFENNVVIEDDNGFLHFGLQREVEARFDQHLTVHGDAHAVIKAADPCLTAVGHVGPALAATLAAEEEAFTVWWAPVRARYRDPAFRERVREMLARPR